VGGYPMMRIPKFYYRTGPVVGGAHAGKIGWWISERPRAGFVVHPAFMEQGREIPHFYISQRIYMLNNSRQLQVYRSGAGDKRGARWVEYQRAAEAINREGRSGFMVASIYQQEAIRMLTWIDQGMASSLPDHWRGMKEIGNTVILDGFRLKAESRRPAGELDRAFNWNRDIHLPLRAQIWDREGRRTYGPEITSTIHLPSPDRSSGTTSNGISRDYFSYSYAGAIHRIRDDRGPGWDFRDVFLPVGFNTRGSAAGARRTIPSDFFWHRQTSPSLRHRNFMVRSALSYLRLDFDSEGQGYHKIFVRLAKV
ncbi:MAG: hypothetical protein AAF442_10095, partial [Pseudomonadota bacterium]